MTAGLLCATPPAHAGFLGKMKKKVDKVSGKADETNARIDAKTAQATQPLTDAQQAAADAQNKAMAPVYNAQGKVVNARNTAMQPVYATKSRVNNMKSQISGAANLTDGAFLKDSALRGYKLDALPSADGRALRLTGTVRNEMERAQAQQLAAHNFPGTIQNQIRIAPSTVKASAKSNLRNGRAPFKKRR